MSPSAAFLIAFLLAAVIVRLLAGERLSRLVLDVPNERSLHSRPVPRTGGVGLMLAAATTWLAFANSALPLLVALTIALAALFLVDDIRGLSVSVRLGAQFIAALAFAVGNAPFPWAFILVPMLILGIVWSCNLYNFMDGANGMAGGMALFGFGTYAVAGHQAGAADIAVVSAIVAGAAAGFLVWNFDPARIFLGDAGSIPLGFLAAGIGLVGWNRGDWPFWLPLLTFSPFIADACVTLVRRALRGERLSQAHKTHYYQRLVRMGWSHRRLALTQYVLMASVAASAVAGRDADIAVVATMLVGWAIVFAAIAVLVDDQWATAGDDR